MTLAVIMTASKINLKATTTESSSAIVAFKFYLYHHSQAFAGTTLPSLRSLAYSAVAVNNTSEDEFSAVSQES